MSLTDLIVFTESRYSFSIERRKKKKEKKKKNRSVYSDIHHLTHIYIYKRERERERERIVLCLERISFYLRNRVTRFFDRE